jgi:hypothetical protein
MARRRVASADRVPRAECRTPAEVGADSLPAEQRSAFLRSWRRRRSGERDMVAGMGQVPDAPWRLVLEMAPLGVASAG